MAASRTGLTSHLKWRKRVLAAGKNNGVTHCPICNVPLDYHVTRKPDSAEPDHIIPAANGGTNTVNNGRVICRLCNQRRGNRIRDPKPRTPTTVEASPIW